MIRVIDRPEPGFYKLRLVRGGPWTPAIIYLPCPLEIHVDAPWQWIDRWPHRVSEIDGKLVDMSRVWTSGERITMAEYLFLTADHAWARKYAPHLPEANPERAIDFNTLLPPGF